MPNGYTTQRVGSVCVEHWRHDGNVVIQEYSDGHCLVHKVALEPDGSRRRNKRFNTLLAAMEYSETL